MFNTAVLRSKLEQAKSSALATAERVQQKVLTEENKEKVRLMMERIGNAVEELVEETNPLGKDNEVASEMIDLTYVTDRFIAMGYPGRRRSTLLAVSRHLKMYHKGQYMVLNASEETYDYSAFEDQVLEFKFPGHPAPPLGMLFKMCASVESWIEADPQNVMAVHCLTGRGRTSVVLSCAMTWLGLFETTFEALAFVARRRNEPVERLTIPSQRRYAQYFANVLDGVAPRSDPVVLRRAIMSRAPQFAARGCCPYLQFFKSGKLAFTATRFEKQSDEIDLDAAKEPTWASPDDGPLAFEVDCVVHGDILLRCRHLDDDGSRVSMFRAALHSGFAPVGVLRLAKSQLDGACSDDRFQNDFFIDLIFEPATKTDEEPSHYDALLHRDSRFWAEVRARKRRVAEKKINNETKIDAAAPDPVFAIGAEDPPPSPPQPKQQQPHIATDELLERLAQADALFDDAATAAAAADQQREEEGGAAPAPQDDIDLLEQELREAAPPPAPADPPADTFDIDAFETYLNELGPPAAEEENAVAV
ncbi:hypothetical protein CTAYLR_005783 [Chrysophaeum taylorii]|uniref:Phosphatidylinositol-3,4,5-trisphosphate 3-phosphatase n=1 Tax=Chrysophaeum taylorii TaxID=2483200 RepID=A0AAD7XMF6_9STRA|nr:hypothetical protein CTAYLR_005783 [Chrysophaeum taylorii]